MPELTLQDLRKLQLEDFSWIHLEGRNRENLLLMLEHLAAVKDSVKVSVEVEKVGRDFEDFIPLADVVFVSKVELQKLRVLLFPPGRGSMARLC